MMLRALKLHFSLHPRLCAKAAAAAASTAAGWGWSLAQWGAMFAGVASRMWMDGDHIGPAKIAVAAITATLIFPTAYRKAMAESESHFLKLCVTFAAGHGYSAMLNSL